MVNLKLQNASGRAVHVSFRQRDAAPTYRLAVTTAQNCIRVLEKIVVGMTYKLGETVVTMTLHYAAMIE